MNIDTGMQIDLLSALRRRAWMMVAIAGGVFLVGYWIAMALPNEYTSYATLLVEPQAISDRLVEAGVGESDINTRLNLMTAEILSRPRLSRIIDELGLYEEESEYMLREEIIDSMRSKVVVAPVLPELTEGLPNKRGIDINTFQIFFTSDNARTAAAVAQRLANDFIEEHISARVQMTGKSLEFISTEQDRLRDAIRRVDEQIALVKSENVGSLPEEMGTNQRMAERTIGDLRDAQRDLDTARSEESFWKNQTITASASAPRDDASPERRIQLLDLSLAEMRARGFTEKHPDVIKVQQEIAAVREQMAITAATEEEPTEQPLSFAEQTAEAERRRAGLRVESTSAEVARLERQLAAIQTRIDKTPRVTEQLLSLEREQVQLRTTLRDFSNRRQEASVQADLERRQLGEQFRVLEAAFPPIAPSAPNRLMVLAMSLLAGLALGAGAGILAESLDGSVHGARELQAALGVPVLVTIPAIVLESDRARAVRRRIQTAVAAAAFAVFCLVGGAVTYMVVNGAPGWIQNLVADEEEPGNAAAPRDATRSVAAR